MVKILLSVLSLFVFGTNHGANYQNISPQKLINKMLIAIQNVNTLAYTLTNTERIAGKFLTGRQFVKYEKTPFKCFIYLVEPSPGSEVLYVAGKNNNLAIYNPKGFPYIRMNLDPLGNLMQRNNHHPIFDIGFAYFAEVVKKNMAQTKLQISYDGDTTWDGQFCYKITLQNNNFNYYTYTTKNNESLFGIAHNLGLSLYMIKKLNSTYPALSILVPGTKIKLPSSYAKKIVLYINKITMLPVIQKIFDDKGLYEEYQYQKIIVNPKFTAKDFDKSVLNSKKM